MTEDAQVIMTDRSRITDAESCMRKRYWRYEHGGRGIERPGNWLDPLMGTAFHNGAEYLLVGKSLEESIAYAKETMLMARREGPILVYRPSTNQEADFNEGMTLVEGLIRGWAIVRLPDILHEYDVLLIEREMTVDYRCSGQNIRQLTRPDIVLERKSDKALFVRNLKTASRVDDKWQTKWQLDMSTFSEAAAVEALLGRQVTGTVMEGIIKGSRECYPKGSSDYHWSSPLVRPWKRDGEPPMTQDEWYGRYEWQCFGPHTMDGGKKCGGNKTHRLSQVHKASVSEYPGGVAAWVGRLALTDRALLEEQFVTLTPILRSPYEVERWKRMKLPIEVDIRGHRDYLMTLSDDDPVKEELRDQWFPMSTAEGNCVWPTQCAFYGLCHGTGDLGEFVARDPNHPNEFGEEG